MGNDGDEAGSAAGVMRSPRTPGHLGAAACRVRAFAAV